MPASYINDQWVQEDSLSMGKAGDAVARMALEVSPPFTIGVTGKWGCGKTSVMRRAFATLGGQPISQSLQLSEDKREPSEDSEKIHCRYGGRTSELKWTNTLYDLANQSLGIWYSPWQHQDAANPLVPLLQEIRNQYTVKRKWLEQGKQLNRQGGLAALTLLEHVIDAVISMTCNRGRPTKMAVGITENVRKAWREDNPENLTKPSDGQRFHLLFEDAVENVLTDLHATRLNSETPSSKSRNAKKEPRQPPLLGDARLIIFIDDLDRCEEKAVVTLLEAIKLYLGTRRCVFILGVDDVAVGDALKRHWQGRSDDSNREYLEKLFQASIPVPQPSQADLQTLIIDQLKHHEFPEEAREQLAIDMLALLEPNPRKVKNFLNSLCANWQLLRCKELEILENCRRLLMFQYLRLNHRAVWRLLEREPGLLPLLHRVLIGNSIESVPGYQKDDLRITEEIFSRSFAHVLKHDDDKDLKLHRKQSLDSAVDKALERLDRRRSDHYFVAWARNLGADEVLHDMFLQISTQHSKS